MHTATLLVGFATACAAQQLQTLASSASAGFDKPRFTSSKGGKAICVEGMIPVQASAQNAMYQIPADISQLAITQMFVSQVSAGATSMESPPMTTISGTYDIYGKLCVPVDSKATAEYNTVQLLTHGLGFDRTYWDVVEGGSYVDVAAEAGKVTFSYDRLGTGMSCKPDPIRVVQAPLEAAILAKLVEMLKSGSIASTKFQKVVGVGHSFGSLLTVTVTEQDPTTFDGIVLTGFSLNMTGAGPFTAGLDLQIAAQNAPLRFSGLPNGYVVDGSESANQFGFFHYPGFPESNLRLAENTKGVISLGELSGLGSSTPKPSSFSGPLDVVNGQFDLPFCTGNCSYPTNLAQQVQTMLFPSASKTSTTYLAPGSGHGVNLHDSATLAYNQIQKFVADSGL